MQIHLSRSQKRQPSFLGTNLPDLVTDWKDGSYPDEHEEYDRGYSDGRKDMLKEIIEKEAKQ